MKNQLDGLEDSLNTFIEGMLNARAQKAVEKMKEDAEGDENRLRDSLTYATISETPRPGGNAQSGDEVPTVTEKNTVVLGTRVPYAIYVEKGTGQHLTDDQAQDFEDSITDWGRRHGFSEAGIFFLKKSIREKGTPAKPFFHSHAIDLMNQKGEMGKEVLGKVKELFMKVNSNVDYFKKVEVQIKL